LQSKKESVVKMIIVNVKENESIDKALKRFKKKFERTGVLKELRSRTYFEKPSVRRRNEVLRAAYRQSMQDQENN
jgi:small subunit ribosomal protein S21